MARRWTSRPPSARLLPCFHLGCRVRRRFAQRISTISGVAQVNVAGQQKYAVHVQVDPRKMAARGIGINEVAQAIQNWNVNVPTGTPYGPHTGYNAQSSGQLMRAAEYRPMAIAWKNGRPIRLEDV